MLPTTTTTTYNYNYYNYCYYNYYCYNYHYHLIVHCHYFLCCSFLRACCKTTIILAKPMLPNTTTSSHQPGLYQESHGIVLNDMYDPESGAWFHKGRSSVPGMAWWDGGEPIWVSAELQNRTAGVCFWAGGSEEIRGVRPSFSVPWQREYAWELKVQDAIKWFADDNVDVALLYHNQPDEAGHHYGPYSRQSNDSVRTVDENLGVLLDALDNNGLSESVNVLVVSDHGMATVDGTRLVDLHDYINASDYKVVLAANSVCMILPEEGRKHEVYRKLHGQHPNMTVFHRHELPEHWHYKHHRRILPIVIVMDEGWQCVEVSSTRPTASLIQYIRARH
jgi:ectonucleotide pyrophosphatase/phosphodiesterase family protein 5